MEEFDTTNYKPVYNNPPYEPTAWEAAQPVNNHWPITPEDHAVNARAWDIGMSRSVRVRL